MKIKWKDLNVQNKTIMIAGVKGHRTRQYQISDELVNLLMRIPKESEKIFKVKNPRTINDWLMILALTCNFESVRF